MTDPLQDLIFIDFFIVFGLSFMYISLMQASNGRLIQVCFIIRLHLKCDRISYAYYAIAPTILFFYSFGALCHFIKIANLVLGNDKSWIAFRNKVEILDNPIWICWRCEKNPTNIWSMWGCVFPANTLSLYLLLTYSHGKYTNTVTVWYVPLLQCIVALLWFSLLCISYHAINRMQICMRAWNAWNARKHICAVYI